MLMMLNRSFVVHSLGYCVCTDEAKASVKALSVDEDNKSTFEACAVCFEDHTPEQESVQLPCKHVFHAGMCYVRVCVCHFGGVQPRKCVFGYYPILYTNFCSLPPPSLHTAVARQAQHMPHLPLRSEHRPTRAVNHTQHTQHTHYTL
jgi:hypothetical protein